jgi:hypothetical protein
MKKKKEVGIRTNKIYRTKRKKKGGNTGEGRETERGGGCM